MALNQKIGQLWGPTARWQLGPFWDPLELYGPILDLNELI